MKVARGQQPPNYEEVATVFPAARRVGVMFCYGGTIFIPHPHPRDAGLHASLLAHEKVHSVRQGDDPAGWWRRYLAEIQFRFDEELIAHRAEYEWFSAQPRGERRRALRQIAARLAGPLYGHVTTPHRAKQMITGKENPEP